MESLTDARLFDIEDVPTAVDHFDNSLAARFGIAPFSVLNAREGWWQDRKGQWMDLGLRSAEGRDARAFGSDGATDDVSTAITERGGGVSVFDPVLAELIVRWHSPADGHVLDPFAGGSVRGLVSAYLGRTYDGIDLSAEQLTANAEQAAEWLDGGLIDHLPDWWIGDAVDPEQYAPDCADLVMTCPPYYDLEHYSEDPADLSNMTPTQFEQAIKAVVANTAMALKDDRYAVWVIGDVRDPRKGKGNLRNFPSVLTNAYAAAGMTYWNEMVLVTSVGSLAPRVARQWNATRKIGRTHQTVLTFLKGDPDRAAAAMDPDPTRGTR
jgi:hypothetical protein